MWNFAGGQVNQYLAACLPLLGLPVTSSNGLRIKIDDRCSIRELEEALATAASGELSPRIGREHPMLKGLKFSDLLPDELLQEAGVARIFGDRPWEWVDRKLEVFEGE